MSVSHICMNCHTLFHSRSFIVFTTSTRLWLSLRVKRRVSQVEQELLTHSESLDCFSSVLYVCWCWLLFVNRYWYPLPFLYFDCITYFSALVLLADISLEIHSRASCALCKHCFFITSRCVCMWYLHITTIVYNLIICLV